MYKFNTESKEANSVGKINHVASCPALTDSRQTLLHWVEGNAFLKQQFA